MRKTLLTLIVGLSLTAMLSAMMWPDDFTQTLTKKLHALQENLRMEKVYVQMDKMHYRAGETIWLAGYVRALTNFSTAGESEILHIELLNAAGNEVETRGFQVVDGKAEGTLELPKDLPTGNYQLRAYTHWQLNEKNPAIFHQQVFVKGITAQKETPAAKTSNAYTLDFMPEGGSLVYGLKSRIAFNMVDSKGLPVEVEGQIKDEQGTLVTAFSSAIHGMGAFDLLPEEGIEYTVEITKPDNFNGKVNLPKALGKGVVLRLENIDEASAEISLQSSERQRLQIILRQGGKIVYQGTTETQDTQITKHIPFVDLQMGVAQLTLFDTEMRPLAERLLYVESNKKLNIEVKTDKETYGPGEEVNLSLTVSDENGRPCAADLSLAAIEMELATASAGKGSSMISWMTLESELKGSIYKPQSFFYASTLVNKEGVDYLLMTQGWRRYEWQHLLSQSPEMPAYPAEQLALTGTVVNAYNQLPLAGAQVMLNEGEQVVETDKNGQFVLSRTHPERGVTLYVSSPGFGTQQQRIIGMPTALKYEMQVQAVVTPQTRDRLGVKPNRARVALQDPAPHIDREINNLFGPSLLPYDWPQARFKPVAQVESVFIEPVFNKETAILNMKEVGIYSYGRVPVFPRDPNLQSVTQFDAAEIEHISVRGVNDFASLSAGVYQSDSESASISIRGARPSGTMYIVDGVKVRGGAELPQGAMDKVQVYLGGAPAEFGDFTGGVIVMESKGPRMMWMMDTVAIIEKWPQATNLEDVLSQITPPKGEVKGACSVTVFVDENGQYKRHRLSWTTHREWSKILKPLLPQLQFDPAITTEGTPYPYHVDMPFAFYADDELAKDHPTDTLSLPELQSKTDFYAARSFYVPSAEAMKGKYDDRTTLYWNGRLKVPASGRLVVRFRTSDVATRFGIVVEGIGEEGRIGRMTIGE